MGGGVQVVGESGEGGEGDSDAGASGIRARVSSGAIVARSVIAHVLGQRNASVLVLAGTDTGALAALHHAEFAVAHAATVHERHWSDSAQPPAHIAVLADGGVFLNHNGAVAAAPGVQGHLAGAGGVAAWHPACTVQANSSADTAVQVSDTVVTTVIRTSGTFTVEQTLVSTNTRPAPAAPCCLIASCMVRQFVPPGVQTMFLDNRFDPFEVAQLYWPSRTAGTLKAGVRSDGSGLGARVPAADDGGGGLMGMRAVDTTTVSGLSESALADAASRRLVGSSEDKDARSATSVLSGLNELGYAHSGLHTSWLSSRAVSWVSTGCMQHGLLATPDDALLYAQGRAVPANLIGMAETVTPGRWNRVTTPHGAAVSSVVGDLVARPPPPAGAAAGAISGPGGSGSAGAGPTAAAADHEPVAQSVATWASRVAAQRSVSAGDPFVAVRRTDDCMFPACNPTCPEVAVDDALVDGTLSDGFVLTMYLVALAVFAAATAIYLLLLCVHLRYTRWYAHEGMQLRSLGASTPAKFEGGSPSHEAGKPSAGGGGGRGGAQPAATAKVLPLGFDSDGGDAKETAGGADALRTPRSTTAHATTPTSAGVPSIVPVGLSCFKVGLTANAGTPAEKNILTDVTFFANPGTVTAIMGPSGCGKTTLLNMLARKVSMAPHMRRRGAVLANGISITTAGLSEALEPHVALVRQFGSAATALSGMTARESLLYAAHLRIPGATWKQRAQRVDAVMALAGISHCADTVVGADGVSSGLSGGQRRLLSVAVALLRSPSVLLTDEPSSGLDSASADELAATFSRLASYGMTIVQTIHQPRLEILNRFSRLLLLSRQGKVAFFDAPSAITMAVLPYLRVPGPDTPLGAAHTVAPTARRPTVTADMPAPLALVSSTANPADLLLDAVTQHGEEMAIMYSASQGHRDAVASIGEASATMRAQPVMVADTVATLQEHTEVLGEGADGALRSLLRSFWVLESRSLGDVSLASYFVPYVTVLGGGLLCLVAMPQTQSTYSLAVGALIGVTLTSMVSRSQTWGLMLASGSVLRFEVEDGVIGYLVFASHAAVRFVATSALLSIVFVVPWYFGSVPIDNWDVSMVPRITAVLAMSNVCVAVVDLTLFMISPALAKGAVPRAANAGLNYWSGFMVPNSITSFVWTSTTRWWFAWVYYVNPLYFAFTVMVMYTAGLQMDSCADQGSPVLCKIPRQELVDYFGASFSDVCDECYVLALCGITVLCVLGYVGVAWRKDRKRAREAAMTHGHGSGSAGGGGGSGGGGGGAGAVPASAVSGHMKPAGWIKTRDSSGGFSVQSAPGGANGGTTFEAGPQLGSAVSMSELTGRRPGGSHGGDAASTGDGAGPGGGRGGASSGGTASRGTRGAQADADNAGVRTPPRSTSGDSTGSAGRAAVFTPVPGWESRTHTPTTPRGGGGSFHRSVGATSPNDSLQSSGDADGVVTGEARRVNSSHKLRFNGHSMTLRERLHAFRSTKAVVSAANALKATAGAKAGRRASAGGGGVGAGASAGGSATSSASGAAAAAGAGEPGSPKRRIATTFGMSSKLKIVKKLFVFTSQEGAMEIFDDVFYATCAMKLFLGRWRADYLARRAKARASAVAGKGLDGGAAAQREAARALAVAKQERRRSSTTLAAMYTGQRESLAAWQAELPVEVLKFVVGVAQKQLLKRTMKARYGQLQVSGHLGSAADAAPSRDSIASASARGIAKVKMPRIHFFPYGKSAGSVRVDFGSHSTVGSHSTRGRGLGSKGNASARRRAAGTGSHNVATALGGANAAAVATGSAGAGAGSGSPGAAGIVGRTGAGAGVSRGQGELAASGDSMLSGSRKDLYASAMAGSLEGSWDDLASSVASDGGEGAVGDGRGGGAAGRALDSGRTVESDASGHSLDALVNEVDDAMTAPLSGPDRVAEVSKSKRLDRMVSIPETDD